MKNYSARDLIDELMRIIATTGISHEDFVSAMMSVMYYDLVSSEKHENFITNDDGEIMLRVERFK